MSHRRVLGVPARVDQAENYFARVDPNTNLDPRPALLFELFAATAKRVAHRADKRDRAQVVKELGGGLPKLHEHHQQLARSRHRYYHEQHDQFVRLQASGGVR